MECVSWLLAIAVVWLIVRDVRARDRLASLEAFQRSQEQLVATLLERLEGVQRELRSLKPPPPSPIETPAPPPPPVPPREVMVAPPPVPLTPVPPPRVTPPPAPEAPPPP